MTLITRRGRTRPTIIAASALTVAVGLAACSPSSNTDGQGGDGDSAGDPDGTASEQLGISDEDYSLEALIEAAQDEGPITVVDATGKIVDMAEAFTEKYGIEATGVKLNAQEQEQIIQREGDAGNVQTDVFNMSNLPSVMSRIVPQDYGVSWMPPDLVDEVPEGYQDPAITSNNPWVWAYNTEVHGETCPVSNMWELTDEEWEGRISIPDPLVRNETMFWFNQIETHHDDLMAEAYEAHYGESLESTEDSATAEWVKRFAANSPSVVQSDTEAAETVGAPGQSDPFFGFTSTALFRENDQSNWQLGICSGMEPWTGQLTPRVAVIASGTEHPNASKLFVHYMMSGEGMGPQLVDGKIATHTGTPMPEDEASGIEEYVDELHVTDSSTTSDDFDRLQDWQDLWTINHG